MGQKEQAKAQKLAELDGETITLTGDIDRIPSRDLQTGEPSTSFIATLSDGRRVWLPSHVMNNFDEGGIAGTYRVEAFTSKKFNTSSARLRNA